MSLISKKSILEDLHHNDVKIKLVHNETIKILLIMTVNIIYQLYIYQMT